MFRKKNKKEVIVDRSAMLRAPAHHPLHFLYALLLGLSFAGALWQYGQPQLTIGLLIAVIPCSLVVFIPYSIYPSMLRIVVNCLIFGGVCAWSLFRMKQGTLPDKSMLESLAAASLIFLMNGQRRDRSYLLFISIFLIIYGALIPRMLYLWLLFPYFILLLVLLYVNRPESLAGRQVTGKRAGSLRRSWPYYLLSLLLGLMVFWYLFGIMPLTNNDIPGMFEVSFLTEKDSALPPALQEWMHNDKVKQSAAGQKIIRNGKPDTVESSGTPIRLRNPKGETKAEGDGGGSSQGKDLLFYAKSPLKLYHLAQLYDVYDGEQWTTSTRLKRAKLNSGNEISLFHQINQNYTIVKWISPKLYAAFVPLSYQTQDAKLLPVRMHTTYFNAELAGKEYPATPFRYAATSAVAFPRTQEKAPAPPPTPPPRPHRRWNPPQDKDEKIDPQREERRKRFRQRMAERRKQAAIQAQKQGKQTTARKKNAKTPAAVQAALPKPAGKDSSAQTRQIKTNPVKQPPKRKRPPRDPYWPENIPKSYYLQLPKKKISAKVRELAKNLTTGLESPYEKAVALRDHLRNNYKYVLYAQKVPEGKEPVDYFLFTLKEGHCEYYASVLAVLARSVGLPARVAVGFSPGNYNTMTGLFEVHEYHAHAWTQIFIDKIGWLTFDATPPQYVRSETRPIGIGSLRDPFGDEWRITPPEMTEHTLGYIRSDIIREARKEEDASVLEKALIQTAVAQEAIQKNIKKTYQSAKKQFDKKNRAGILFKLQLALNTLHGKITKTLLYIRHSWIVILMALIIILASGSIFRRAAKLLGNHYKRKKMEQFMQTARQEVRSNPAKSIRAVYFALRLSLELARLLRKRNMELLDYADSLDAKDHELAEKTYRVFLVFYKLEYGSFVPGAGDSERVLALFEDIQKRLEILKDRKT